MAYQKPEIIDGGPTGDTVSDGIMKTDINVDDIYSALNDLLSQMPDDLDPNAYYRVDGSNELIAPFRAGGFMLRDCAPPLEDTDAATQGWSNSQFLSLGGGTVTGSITCSVEPSHDHHLANKLYVDTHGGGSGGVESVNGKTGVVVIDYNDVGAAEVGHGHSDVSHTTSGFMSFSDKEKLDNMNDPALLLEFKSFSTGTPDNGHPIKLNDYGVLDASFFDVKIFNLQGDFTPTAGAEYPSPAEGGDYWIIEGVGDITSGGYTFTGGFLQGREIFDNELLVKGRDDAWGIIHMKVDPRLYYKLDGSNHITANFQAGGFKLSNIAAGTSDSDAVRLSQLNTKLDLSGGTMTGHISYSPAPTADAHLANKAYVDAQGGGSDWEDVRVMDFGANVSGDGACRIDFHAQESPTDWDMVIYRNSGVNGDCGITNSGTGGLNLDSNGPLLFNGSRVLTEDYHPLPYPIDADLLGGLAPDQYARLGYLNQFAKGCVRIGPDDENGFVVWRTRYQGINIYMGESNHPTLGWGNYISSALGDAPGASKQTLRVVSTLSSDSSGVDDLGEVSTPWKELFTTIAPYTVADETKVRAVASISGLDADFILTLTPKTFEVTPTGVYGNPFLADIPAPTTAKTQFGFIAQDVEAAMTSAGYNPADYALTTGPTGHKFINQTELIPLLVKKIQDLEARLSILEA